MKLTPHFSLEEFRQFARHGFKEQPYPELWIEPRLLPLCWQLEILRDALNGHPIRVISGFRTRTYNKKIGGATNSQHMHGRAADIIVPKVKPVEVYNTALKLYLHEKLFIGGMGLYDKFVHIDVRPIIKLVRWNGKRKKV